MLHLRQALDLLMKLLILGMICVDFKKSMCMIFVTKMGKSYNIRMDRSVSTTVI